MPKKKPSLLRGIKYAASKYREGGRKFGKMVSNVVNKGKVRISPAKVTRSSRATSTPQTSTSTPATKFKSTLPNQRTYGKGWGP